MNAISLQLPNELGERLTRLADQTGRSKAYYMLEAISQHIENLEDTYLAEQCLADIRAGRSRVYSSEEVEALLHVGD